MSDDPKRTRPVPSGLDASALREEVRRLRRRPGWDPAKLVTEHPMEQLMRLEQEARDEAVYAATDTCAACAAVRTRDGDPTALCPEHLAEAMGF